MFFKMLRMVDITSNCIFHIPHKIGLQFILFISIIAHIPCPVLADIYAYVDEHGIKHYSNVPADPRYRLKSLPKVGSVSRLVGRFDRYIRKAAETYEIDPLLIKAIVKVESGFNPRAVSSRGAMGLMQLMPETAKDMDVPNPYDPEENIFGGTRYLRWILDRFDGDLKLALAAYNAGPDRVERTGRIPKIPETVQYVDRVLNNYERYHISSPRNSKWEKYAFD